MEPMDRNAVRVVLLDARQRILLQQIEFPATFEEDNVKVWITPGGGIDPGERPEDAAARELSEELGLESVAIEGPIWKREHTFTFEGKVYRQKELFYVAKVDSHEASPTELLDPYVLSHRWWSLREIDAAVDVKFAPRELARHLKELLASGHPTSLIDVGV